MWQSSERFEVWSSGVHRWCAAAWIAGALLAPPLEGAAYAVLAAVALVRCKAFVGMLSLHLRLRFVVVTYAAVLSWAFLSTAWSPDGAEGKVYARIMIVPFFVIHAGLTLQVMATILFWPGAIWSAVLVAAWLGVPVPSLIVPDHPSKAALGLVMLGCVAFSGVVDRNAARGWSQWCLKIPIWFAGAAVASSRTGVVAVLSGSLLGFALTRRSIRHALRTIMPLAVGFVVIAGALGFTPVGKKALASLASLGDTSAVTRSIADRLDSTLSFRLGLWDWTMTACSHVFVGHGALSWPHDFRAAMTEGKPRVTIVTSIPPQAGSLNHAHSILIQMMYEQGLIGVALLIGFVAAVGNLAWNRRDTASGTLLVVVALAIAIMSLTEGALLTRSSAATFTILIGLCSVDSTATKPG
jgi:hypothetical protein